MRFVRCCAVLAGIYAASSGIGSAADAVNTQGPLTRLRSRELTPDQFR
jgi:hypothetical protein